MDTRYPAYTYLNFYCQWTSGRTATTPLRAAAQSTTKDCGTNEVASLINTDQGTPADVKGNYVYY